MNLDNILDFNKTITKDLFFNVDNYWEVLPKIKEYIIELGTSLDKDKYEEVEENIWVGKNVVIDKFSTIIAPCIIDDDTVVRPGAYIRGNVIIGKKCVIGNSTEIKNSIIFDEAQLPHYNYVGDSIVGNHAHLGAGVILSNLKNDKSNVIIKDNDVRIDTGLRKMGAIIGDYVDVGCNSVCFPGTIIKNNTSVYPLVRVRGVISSNCIMKDDKIVVEREDR